MHRLLVASVVGVALGLALAGCDCGDDVVLEIVEPLDGATLNLASDVDAGADGVQVVVLVATEGLDRGARVQLTVGTTTVSGDVGASGAVRYEVTLPEGDSTIVAKAEGVSSSTVTVTLDTGSVECPDISITKPDKPTLVAADDEDGEACGTFTYTIVASTNAQAGRGAELWVNGNSVADGTVEGAEIRFESATLDPGANDIEVRLTGEGDCSASAAATVDCGVTCSITDPLGDVLNADADDAPGEPGMQSDFTVETDADDGQLVELLVDDEQSGSADALGGQARFDSISLPEGERVAQAVCRDVAGNEARSSRVRFHVDTLAPQVIVAQPAEDDVFNLSRDDDPSTEGLQVRVCATSDEDGDYCAAIAGGAPGADGCGDALRGTEVCGFVDCAGNGTVPVNLEARVTDAAGNDGVASVQVFCDTGTPVVAIADPLDGQALSAAQDEDAGRPGMQYAVTVCTDAPVGAQVELFQDGRSAAHADVASVQCAAPALGNPVSGTATFAGLDLADGPVVLRAEVPSPGGNRGVSPSVNVDIDTTPPSVAWLNLACGAVVLSPADDSDGIGANGIQYTVNARVNGALANSPVEGTITYEDRSTDTFRDDSIDGFGFASFPNITFQQGANTLSVTIADAAGNVATADCTVAANVGGFARIDSPLAGAIFRAASDGDAGIAGFQGAVVRVVSDGPVNGMDVRVLADGLEVGRTRYTSAGGMDLTIDLPEGSALDNAVTLTAETIGHPADPLVSTAVRVLVDTLPPSAPAGVVASVIASRSGSVAITFPAPGDPVGRPVAAYQVRQSTAAIAAENDGVPIQALGVPVQPGSDQTLTISGLFPGASYYFAVRAVDGVGNVGSSGVSSATSVSFTTDTVESPSQTAFFSFGYSVVGGGDVNGDGFDDLVVGTIDGTNRAYLFYGSVAGLSATPDVTFDGTGGLAFGSKVALLGQMNGDAFADIAIGDYTSGASGQGRVYVFFGGDSLPASLSPPDADITISGTDADVWLGSRLSTAGDVNGDGYSDLLVGGVRYGSNLGEAFVVLGEQNPPTAVSLPGDADLRIIGTVAGARTAFVAPAGRLDGDGLDDLIVSGCRSARNGSVYVFYGESSASLASDPVRDAPEADVTLTSPDANDDQYGCAVGGVGDVDGDGFGDIAVGANMHGALDTGVFYLYLSNGQGGFNPPLVYANTRPNSDGDRLGSGVAWTLGLEGAEEPSIDADRRADLAIGMNFFGLEPGGLVLHRGGAGLAGGDVGDATGRAQLPAGSYYAFATGYAGDVDGDGFVDLFAGDPYVLVNGADAVGRVYIMR